MLNIGNAQVPLCAGMTRRSFLQVGTAGMAGLTLPNLLGLQQAGAVDGAAPRSRTASRIFLVGSPGHLDTWDMKPDAPAEVRGKFKPIAHQRDRHPDLRALPAHGPDDGQGGADPQPAPQHRRDARERPALDDDRPRFQRRQRQAAHRQRHLARVRPEGRAAGRTSSCRARSATPAPARCTARPPAYLGSAHEPFFLNADPARPDFQVADLEVPAGAERVPRSTPAGSCSTQLDDLQRRTETEQHADARQRLRARLPPADLAAGRRRRST